MIKPVKSVTVSSESPTAEQNQAVNDFIRGAQSVIPRRLRAFEFVAQLEHEDQDGDRDAGN